MKFIKWLWKLVWHPRSLMRPSDKGLFDPFVPITSLKRVENEYQADYKLTNVDEDFERIMSGYGSANGDFDENVEQLPGFLLFKAVVIVVALVLGVRLIGLQITQGEENYSLAEGNRLETKPTPAPRGLIFDRKGVPLVRNEPSFTIELDPADFPKDKTKRQEYLAKLSSVLGRSVEELSTLILPNLNKETVALEEGIDRDRALSLEVKLFGLHGIVLNKTPSRRYGDLPGLGHLIGYIGKVTAEDLEDRQELLSTSLIGKSGVERSYDTELQGLPGTETLEIDSLGRAVRPIGSTLPVPGKSLILGLDAEIQRVTAEALRASIEKNGATSGAAVAMDVRSGDIIAMVSFPTFDNNLFSSSVNSEERKKILSDPGAPLINRAIAGQYPSGSTIKPFVASAALQERTISASTVIDTSEGKIVVGQTTFSDWKTHGRSNVKQAIAESNNIFFFALGGGYKQVTGLGIERLKNYLEKFGFGAATGIDLGEGAEAKGLVPSPDWKKRVKKESWFLGDTYNTSIGQGNLLVTPLQLARATASIANGGKLLQPRVVKTVLAANASQTKDRDPVILKEQIMDEEVLQIVREGMRQAVLSGSARSFSSLPIEVAAKTGTAQTSKSKDKTHSWFTAFAPYNNPEIVVSVIVEGGGEGFAVAAPVAKNTIERYFNLPLTPIVPANPVQENQ
ncbi:MAG: penicillin-binding protein 2 [Candidatus Berkelbacteria bacterium]|nr:MAG: penicillin-binding protein 2 [Candidatus Berkelbacteria bacterium]QQG51874.1 MAG: penicillin-binding protein 2 [Candidatus Berkelbacteria bacterium]